MRIAHQNLMAASPELIHPMMNGGNNDFGIAPTSPTMSKLRRTQTTTLDKATKKPKTYGTKTTMDGIRTKRSRFESSFDEAVIDDAIDFLGPAKKKQKGEPASGPNLGQLLEAREDPQLPSTMSHGGTTVPTELDSNATEATQPSHLDRAKDRTGMSPRSPSVTNPPPEWASPNLQMSSSKEVEDTRNQISADTNEESAIHNHTERVSLRNQNVDFNASLQGSQDELAAAPSPDPPKPTKTSKPKNRVQMDDESAEDASDMFADLPQEQYAPRKSRSRRGNNEVDEFVDNIDFSKRPEAKTKAKSKKEKKKFDRRKTTGGAVVVHLDDDDDDPFAEVQEQPFEPAKSRASKTPYRSIEKDQEEAAPQPEPEPRSSRSRRAVVDEEEEGDENNEETLKGVNSSDRHQAAQMISTINGLNEDEDEGTEEPTPAPEPQPTKKKRGRPRKNPIQESEADSEPKPKSEMKKAKESKGSDERETTTEATEKLTEVVVQVPKKRGRPSRKSTDQSESTAYSKPVLPRESTSPSRSTRPTSNVPEQPKTPSPKKTSQPLAEKTNVANVPIAGQQAAAESLRQEASPKKDGSPQKGPTKHSPLSNSRVKFRVGLSKRARIEPLLRIVKKDKTAS